MSRETLPIVAATEATPAYQENHLSPGDMDLVPERLPDKQARKESKAAVGLPRGKGDALCETPEPPDGDLSDEEKRLWECFGKNILKEFPKWKQKQEEIIRELRALADKVDATHKKTSQINLWTGSAALASGAMSVLGFALAPVSAGGSLMLAAAGQSVGAAAAITSVVTNLMEHFHDRKVKARANSLECTSEPEWEQVDGGRGSYLTALTEVLYKLGNTSQILRKHRRAYKAARAMPDLAKAAKLRVTGGQVSTQTSRYVRSAFDSTPLAMTKTALLKGGGMSAASLLLDIYNFSEDWKKLKKGEKAQLAEDLRAWAGELEEQLQRDSHCYQRLRQKLLEKRTKQKDSSSEKATETRPHSRPRKAGSQGTREKKLKPSHSDTEAETQVKRREESPRRRRSC